MLINIILLIVGLALIIYGADFMTDGASGLARKFGLSDMVIGLTIVAFGTSAPELTISIISAFDGNSGIAIGNVVGSNLFNTLVIIGTVALIHPIKIESNILTNELPMVLLTTIALVCMGCSQYLDHTVPVISRVDGILLILFFAIFMHYIFKKAKSEKLSIENVGYPIEQQKTLKQIPLWRSIIYIIGGLGALIYGGDLFVDKASSLASSLGVSDAIIGLTIVAMGTSFPELATSIVAARKGNSDMAVGNVIGSNLFNIMMVLGCSAIVRPLPFGNVNIIDLGVLLLSALLFLIFGRWFGNRIINRTEGAFLLICYAGYIIYLISVSV